MTALDDTITALIESLRAGDDAARAPLADALVESGLSYAAAYLQVQVIGQRTQIDSCIATVAQVYSESRRYGGRTVAWWATVCYRSVQRSTSPLLVWHRVLGCRDAVIGRRVTRPMIARARDTAASLGIPFGLGIRHGDTCP